MGMPNRFLVTLAAVFALPVLAQDSLELLPAQGNVTMVVGPAGNSAIQVGHEAVIVVDTQTPDVTDDLLAAITSLSDQPIRHIINTSALAEHTGGNSALSAAGTYVRLIDSFDPRGLDANAAIMAHINVLASMSAPIGDDFSIPETAWPTDTYYTEDWAVYVNKEAIRMLHVPNAVTDGDTIVFFRRSDVVVTGAIFNTDRYPFFDSEQGGSINGVIEGLNTILDLAIAGENMIGGTVIIPGHGRMADVTDVANYRDMTTIIRDRIQLMVDDGKTLREVLAARPSSDYDAIYASNDESWTGTELVTAIYRDLSGSEL
jgi:glyoxylase-like metal-dependent hydrolase (beta-lactamase superfamily II)